MLQTSLFNYVKVTIG